MEEKQEMVMRVMIVVEFSEIGGGNGGFGGGKEDDRDTKKEGERERERERELRVSGGRKWQRGEEKED